MADLADYKVGAHYIRTGSVRSPTGRGYQWFGRCDCGWVQVFVATVLLAAGVQEHIRRAKQEMGRTTAPTDSEAT
jgi:hypothetical protein